MCECNGDAAKWLGLMVTNFRLVGYFAAIAGACMLQCSPAKRPSVLRMHCSVMYTFLLTYGVLHLIVGALFSAPGEALSSVALFLAEVSLGVAVAAGALYFVLVFGVSKGPMALHTYTLADEDHIESGTI